jgi:hypothetical protein
MINNDLQTNASQSLTAKMSKDKLNVFKGPEVSLGNGKVRTWISVNKETGMPLEIGIEMTPRALTGLPDGASGVEPPVYILPLHLKATQLTPFDHIGLNWNHNGHPPPGVFDVPHFDFHFYMISVEDQLAIPEWSPETDAAFNLYPPTGYMPADYGTPPGPATAEAQMGKHWLPASFTPPFTKVMVYGSYNGKFIFVEPMITLDYLLSNPDFSEDYHQPQFFQKAGNYPTKYNIYTDTTTGNTYVTLSGFVTRVAGN